ncbi:MAG TPA: glycosyltransferase family 4 protein [Planctomycetota bacterium]|nr:glycosyltransferase family 4 protein [Planctomycetota bacterium]
MNILHVITTLDIGGAEMHVLSQVRGQVERGHRVRIAYLKGEGRLRGDFQAAGAECVTGIGLGPRSLLILWPDLRWADIVHTHLLKADLFGAVAATLAGRRANLIASKHNDEAVLQRALVGQVHGLVGRLPRKTIVLSDHVGRFIAEHGRVPLARQRRIYYGLDPRPFESAARMTAAERAAVRAEFGFGPDPVIFICVARFAAQKAHDVLLRGFARALRERKPGDSPLGLLLVGDDPFGDGRQRAEALARELELGSNVHFAGLRRDVPRLVGASDVFVMTSLWEGLGLVFLEAMAASRAVLATRVSAVPEVVIDEGTGLLVPPSQIEPLAAAMGRLARDPALRARLGVAGHARVLEHFALARMVSETLDVYAAHARRQPPPGG